MGGDRDFPSETVIWRIDVYLRHEKTKLEVLFLLQFRLQFSLVKIR